MTPHPLQHWFPQIARVLERAPMAGLMCAGAILMGVTLAGARSSSPRDNHASPATEENASAVPDLFSEGMELRDEAGSFQLAGGRTIFVSTQKKQRFTVLENQVLQRVSDALAENPLPQRWVVSGTVTEYRGYYYLLITRAVQKNISLPETGS